MFAYGSFWKQTGKQGLQGSSRTLVNSYRLESNTVGIWGDCSGAAFPVAEEGPKAMFLHNIFNSHQVLMKMSAKYLFTVSGSRFTTLANTYLFLCRSKWTTNRCFLQNVLTKYLFIDILCFYGPTKVYDFRNNVSFLMYKTVTVTGIVMNFYSKWTVSIQSFSLCIGAAEQVGWLKLKYTV